MLGLIKKVFDYNQRELNRLRKIVDQINGLESRFEKLSDKQLRQKTVDFKDKLRAGKKPEEILPEAFAAVREAAKRAIGERNFDVQLMAAIALFEGKIAEQKTGEGKTLTATPALYLRALEGKGAYLVTVNDYLARIGAGWMAPIFDFLGLSVGCIIPDASYLYDSKYKTSVDDKRLTHLKPVSRKEAYEADITYGTNNEFGFDYLRDNMARSLNEVVQKNHYFAVVDEVDFALIDEARTPLIISSPQDEPVDKYYRFATLAGQLLADDYIIDEKARSVTLTEFGIRKVERMLGVDNLYEKDFETIHHIENALKAKALFHKDKEYVIKDGQVLIVDEFTGRLMHGRRWSDGLHQAVEAKEGVQIQQESKTWATISFQNYFRLYEKLAGMTGTAATEREEFRKIYDLDVVELPTNKSMIRQDHPDVIYKNQRAKYAAIAQEVEDCYQKGQPVLIGTTSIEKNEIVASLLKKKRIPHQILNAKNHEKEALIIAQAGSKGAVTVATNMAGRGVDIILGGDKPDKKSKDYEKWQKEHDDVLALGGLHVIGTERHEARRIDNQLRGRAGRQGDPGSSRFFVALDDDLMRIFGGDQIANLMTRFNIPENIPLSHSMVSRLIEQIQTKVEGFNFDIRRSLVEFDDVVNKQREIIYQTRGKILQEAAYQPERLTENIFERLEREIKKTVDLAVDVVTEKIDLERLIGEFREIIPLQADDLEVIKSQVRDKRKEEIADYLIKITKDAYLSRSQEWGEEISHEVEKSVLLMTIDQLWVDHLTILDNLREGIKLRGYAQRDPLVEYRREGFEMFQSLLVKIDYNLARRIFKIELRGSQPQAPRRITETRERMTAYDAVKPEATILQPQATISGIKTPGRNDPCPCGSGKKYKKCCYPKYG